MVELFTHYQGLRPTDRIWTGFAFFWVGGHNSAILPCLFVGAALYFSETPKPKDAVDLILREKITVVALWPSQSQGILEEAARRGVALDSVRRGVGPRLDDKGAAIPPDRICSPLGMTETFGMHSMEDYEAPTPPGKLKTVGRALAGVERRIVAPDTGLEVETGQQGELFVRGGSLMAGYYKREREDTFTRDGFFATGDLVSVDEEGFLYFHGRLNEMIKTSGANVSPREVEVAIQAFPGVREAIVLGLPDAVKGEVVVAVVAPADGQVLDGEELRARLKEEVSPYKVPQRILIVHYDRIPRTGSEKAIKRELKVLFAEAESRDLQPASKEHQA
jgi:acyl-CoA synthetase (AMP-forming)/AMP-acid ligase II